MEDCCYSGRLESILDIDSLLITNKKCKKVKKEKFLTGKFSELSKFCQKMKKVRRRGVHRCTKHAFKHSIVSLTRQELKTCVRVITFKGGLSRERELTSSKHACPMRSEIR